MDDDQPYDEIDYGPHEAATFNTWVELGARNPDDQGVLEFAPMTRYTKKLKSSSPEAEALIHGPLQALLEDRIPGVTPESSITTTVLHHERGLRKRIIRATISVESSTGDVSMEFDKETW
ncbi:MAG TPA: hypothetical protein VIH24_08495 [Candidatus Limnocylindria bacterium]|jgi:hypothetical protein